MAGNNTRGASAFENYGSSAPVNATPKEELMFKEPVTKIEETKTKRLYLLVKPTVAEKIAAAAKAQKTSTNDLIGQLMEQYVIDNNL